MWKVIQNYLLTNTKEESRNIEMKNPCLKAGSSVIKKGSQKEARSPKEAENEAAEDSDDSRLGDSTQAFEQRNPQIKEDSEDSEDPDEYEDPEDSDDSEDSDSEDSEDSEDSDDSEDPEDSDDLDDLRWRDSTQTNEQKGSQISSQISLHCYRTCKIYTECCPIPDKCRQLRKEEKMCPIRQLRKEHGCGYMDTLPENELAEINQHREVKLERYGITEDGLEIREPRDYTPYKNQNEDSENSDDTYDAIQIHYVARNLANIPEIKPKTQNQNPIRDTGQVTKFLSPDTFQEQIIFLPLERNTNKAEEAEAQNEDRLDQLTKDTFQGQPHLSPDTFQEQIIFLPLEKNTNEDPKAEEAETQIEDQLDQLELTKDTFQGQPHLSPDTFQEQIIFLPLEKNTNEDPKAEEAETQGADNIFAQNEDQLDQLELTKDTFQGQPHLSPDTFQEQIIFLPLEKNTNEDPEAEEAEAQNEDQLDQLELTKDTFQWQPHLPPDTFQEHIIFLPLEKNTNDKTLTDDNHEKNESTKPLEDSEIIKTHTIDNYQNEGSENSEDSDDTDKTLTDDNQEKNESIKPLEDSESDVEIDPTVDDHEKNESTENSEDSDDTNKTLTDDNQEKNEATKPLEDSESDVEIDPTVDNHEKNESNKPLEDSGSDIESVKTQEDSGMDEEIETTDDDHEKIESIKPLEDSGNNEINKERQMETPSLYEEVIKGLMKWDYWIDGPESRLMQKIEKFDEEDLGEIFSRTSSQFAGKFVEFAVLTGGDSLRKFENFMKGTKYKQILKKKTSYERPKFAEPEISIEAPSANSKAIQRTEQKVTISSKKNDKPKKFCHFFNNGNSCKKGNICKFQHQKSPRCEQVEIGLCAKRICQFTHSEQYVFCEDQSEHSEHSEPYVLCKSNDIAKYNTQKFAQEIMEEDHYDDTVREFCKCPLRKLCQCHAMGSEIPCKKGNTCKLRHENIPNCVRTEFGLCADRFCKFKHVKIPFCTYLACKINKRIQTKCQLKHSEHVKHKENLQSWSAQRVTGEVAAQSLSARVITGKITAPVRKKFCSFFNNGNSCKKGDICKFRHKESPRCEQDKDCANRTCQFRHSKTLRPQKSQSLSAQVITGEVAAPSRKKFCHYFNSYPYVCRKGDSCEFRHEMSPNCEKWEQVANDPNDNDCVYKRCQYRHP